MLLCCFALPLRAAEISGIIHTNTTWTAAGNPHVVIANTTVSSNVTLTIEAGALVQLGPDVSMLAGPRGAIDVRGAPAKLVLLRALTATNDWGRIGADGTNGRVTLRYTDVERGQTTVLNGASGLFENCHFHDYPVTNALAISFWPILASDHAMSLAVRACHFRNFYETIFLSGVIGIEDSLFENISGDGIDFDTVASGSVIQRCTIRRGLVPNADAVDIGVQSSGVLVEHCLIYDFPFDKGVSIGEQSSNIVIRSCLIYGVDMGIAVKDSSEARIVNSTITDSNYGLNLFEKTLGQGGGRVTAWNNLIWNNTNSIGLLDKAILTMSHSNISGPGIYSGLSNLNVNPLFRNSALRDYRLAAHSPARGAGTNGTIIGALFPVGSFLVDTDGDELPDTWEMSQDTDFNDPADAALDADGDRSNNLHEYRAGTDPRDAASVLLARIRHGSNGELALEFRAVREKAYSIEFRDTLESGVWQTLRMIEPASAERLLQLPFATGGAARFFRVVARANP